MIKTLIIQMNSFIRQNKNILLIALSLFISSVIVLLFVLTGDLKETNNLGTNIIRNNHNQEQSNDIKNEESSYRKYAKNDEDPMLIVNLDGKIIYSSLGINIETDKKLFDIIKEEDLPDIMSAFGKAIDTEMSVNMVGPFRLKNKEHKYKICMATITPYIVENNKKVLIFLKDITEEIKKAGTNEEEKYKEFYNKFKQDLLEDLSETSNTNKIKEIQHKKNNKPQKNKLLKDTIKNQIVAYIPTTQDIINPFWPDFPEHLQYFQKSNQEK